MDSPKCLPCLEAGKVAQTYRVSGTTNFKCGDCKTTYPESNFTPIEFQWKDDQDAWKSWIASKGIKLKDPQARVL